VPTGVVVVVYPTAFQKRVILGNYARCSLAPPKFSVSEFIDYLMLSGDPTGIVMQVAICGSSRYSDPNLDKGELYHSVSFIWLKWLRLR